MERIPYAYCNEFFTPRNRKQKFCNKADCQKARKVAWLRNKMATDSDYEADQKLSHKKWTVSGLRTAFLTLVKQKQERLTGVNPKLESLRKTVSI